MIQNLAIPKKKEKKKLIINSSSSSKKNDAMNNGLYKDQPNRMWSNNKFWHIKFSFFL